MSVLQYSSMFNILNTTLRRDIKFIKEVKVIKIKEDKGRTLVLSKYKNKLLCGVILRKDWSNYGISPKEVEEAMIFLNP